MWITLRPHVFPHPLDVKNKIKDEKHLTTAHSDAGQTQEDNIPLPWDNDILRDFQWQLEEQNLRVGQFLHMASSDFSMKC